MIQVSQTKFSLFRSNRERLTYGNCLVACVASILELPIEEVPNIYTFYSKDKTGLWLEVLNMWLSLNGIKLEKVECENVGKYCNVSNYYIKRGLSHRGLPHCIVCGPFKYEWDPHPSREGLKEDQYCYVFVKN